MCASHRQYMLLVQNVFTQPLGAGGIRQTLIQNGFHQRISARNHITHYIEIRGQTGLFCAKAFDQGDALFFQLRAHGRIDPRIATGDGMACRTGNQGQTAHECAANS